ncbi:hypothetical protein GCM10010910_25800 [Microbacterium nanhaiense]|uniref:Two pore domain potassium channel family protein n=1 Tax=Microbacterium nanhaiense TaxID=1301026 RepID=A0ABQ2N5L2_9MICO|nr:hypothetical protein GCM10010910_25800 [Microbacterium nanhaiense]
MRVSRVDIRTFDWPASIMLCASSAGFTYDMLPPMTDGVVNTLTLSIGGFASASLVLRVGEFLLTRAPARR